MRTNAVVFLDARLSPLGHISPLAAAHVQDFSVWTATCAGSAFVGALGKHRMGKACDEDGFHPVVEIFEADDRRVSTLDDAYVRSGVVCARSVTSSPNRSRTNAQ